VEHGIAVDTFRYRISKGWDEWRAATTTILDAKEQREREYAIRRREMSRKYPIEFVDLAARNGITYACFKQRVKRKWNYIDAATIPIIKAVDRGKRLKEIYGEDFFKRVGSGWIPRK
jgi:hypothetical protein